MGTLVGRSGSSTLGALSATTRPPVTTWSSGGNGASPNASWGPSWPCSSTHGSLSAVSISVHLCCSSMWLSSLLLPLRGSWLDLEQPTALQRSDEVLTGVV